MDQLLHHLFQVALGDALAPVFALAVLAAMAWAWDVGPSERILVGGAVALALLLGTGSLAYTALLALAVALLWWPADARRLMAEVRALRRTVVAGFLAALVLGTTFFLITPTGLASAVEHLGRWLGDLAPGAGTYSPWELVRRLLLSEPLLLGFGLAGLIWSIRAGERTGQWAGIAAGVAISLAAAGAPSEKQSAPSPSRPAFSKVDGLPHATQSGGWGLVYGFGSTLRSGIRKYLPSKA